MNIDPNSVASDAPAPIRDDPYKNPNSLEFRFRVRRFEKIRTLIDSLLHDRRQVRIIDLGGTETYWNIGREYIEQRRERLKITLVNRDIEPVEDADLFTSVEGNATDSDLFEGETFDFVHSNSVIEHVGAWTNMEAFAANVRRLAPRYYVQTPNYWFPFEPHFRVAGFQYLPEALRARLIQNFSLGFFHRVDGREEALDIIKHHRLLSTGEMERLFPDAVISHEMFKGLRKSIIATR